MLPMLKSRRCVLKVIAISEKAKVIHKTHFTAIFILVSRGRDEKSLKSAGIEYILRYA